MQSRRFLLSFKDEENAFRFSSTDNSKHHKLLFHDIFRHNNYYDWTVKAMDFIEM